MTGYYSLKCSQNINFYLPIPSLLILKTHRFQPVKPYTSPQLQMKKSTTTSSLSRHSASANKKKTTETSQNPKSTKLDSNIKSQTNYLLQSMQSPINSALRKQLQSQQLQYTSSTCVKSKKSKTKNSSACQKKGDWQAILNQVQFLKKRVCEMENPRPSELTSRGSLQMKQNNKSSQQNMSRNTMLVMSSSNRNTTESLSRQSSSIFASKPAIYNSIHTTNSNPLAQREQVDLLREQILHLRNQNARVNEVLGQTRKELAFQRREAVRLSSMLEDVRRQNLKLREDFLKRDKGYIFQLSDDDKQNNGVFQKQINNKNRAVRSSTLCNTNTNINLGCLRNSDDKGMGLHNNSSNVLSGSSLFGKKETEGKESDINLLSQCALAEYL